MSPEQLAQILEKIADVAPRLRDAGVVGSVQIGDVAFTIAAQADAGAGTFGETVNEGPARQPSRNPLDDPETFGMDADDELPSIMPRKKAKAG